MTEYEESMEQVGQTELTEEDIEKMMNEMEWQELREFGTQPDEVFWADVGEY